MLTSTSSIPIPLTASGQGLGIVGVRSTGTPPPPHSLPIIDGTRGGYIKSSRSLNPLHHPSPSIPPIPSRTLSHPHPHHPSPALSLVFSVPGFPRPRRASFTTTEPALTSQPARTASPGQAQRQGPSPPTRLHRNYQEVREQLTPVKPNTSARDGKGVSQAKVSVLSEGGEGGGIGRVSLREVSQLSMIVFGVLCNKCTLSTCPSSIHIHFYLF